MAYSIGSSFFGQPKETVTKSKADCRNEKILKF